jgi:hypothetical protein
MQDVPRIRGVETDAAGRVTSRPGELQGTEIGPAILGLPLR